MNRCGIAQLALPLAALLGEDMAQVRLRTFEPAVSGSLEALCGTTICL
jgi:hypothetical protein